MAMQFPLKNTPPNPGTPLANHRRRVQVLILSSATRRSQHVTVQYSNLIGGCPAELSVAAFRL